jgi:hypothetical protein
MAIRDLYITLLEKNAWSLPRISGSLGQSIVDNPRLSGAVLGGLAGGGIGAATGEKGKKGKKALTGATLGVGAGLAAGHFGKKLPHSQETKSSLHRAFNMGHTSGYNDASETARMMHGHSVGKMQPDVNPYDEMRKIMNKEAAAGEDLEFDHSIDSKAVAEREHEENRKDAGSTLKGMFGGAGSVETGQTKTMNKLFDGQGGKKETSNPLLKLAFAQVMAEAGVEPNLIGVLSLSFHRELEKIAMEVLHGASQYEHFQPQVQAAADAAPKVVARATPRRVPVGDYAHRSVHLPAGAGTSAAAEGGSILSGLRKLFFKKEAMRLLAPLGLDDETLEKVSASIAGRFGRMVGTGTHEAFNAARTAAPAVTHVPEAFAQSILREAPAAGAGIKRSGQDMLAQIQAMKAGKAPMGAIRG